MSERLLPCDLEAGALTVLIDKDEKLPVNVAPMRSEFCHLDVGDYQLKYLDEVAVCERKSEADLLICLGTERERFHKQVLRLLGCQSKCLVVESTWERLNRGGWRSKIEPSSVTGSLIRLMNLGLPVALVGDHEQAGKFITRFLFLEARRRFREIRGLLGDVRERPKQRLSPNAAEPETLAAFDATLAQEAMP